MASEVVLPIPMTPQDRKLLGKIMKQDLRSAGAQIVWLIRQEGKRRGLTNQMNEGIDVLISHEEETT